MDHKVFLVGAGPGDVNLITVKALDCIKNADVIIYDNLVNDKILSFAPQNAELIYVGKKINLHSMPQEDINNLLIQKSRIYRNVVRLKGGDPFVFGRGAEEALALSNEKIPFEIIPGISSSIAALAYSGIPVTHRGISSSFHVITGHEDPLKEQLSINYEVLSKLTGTLVFLMGLNNLSQICSELLKYGKLPDTPVALISKGTLPEQRVVTGTLNDIENKKKDITYPAIIVVGNVVNLRETLNWFEKKPLFGKNILVTRSRHQASSLSKKIEDLGGNAIEFPTIEIIANESESDLNRIFKQLNNYQWIVFTSVNAVERFFNKYFDTGKDLRFINNTKIAAIGDATKNKLKDFHINVDYMPDEYIAEALAEGLKDKIKSGDKVLIPRADVAREVLQTELENQGVIVEVFSLYKTIIPESKKEDLIEILKNINIITFTSSSTVNNFFQILGQEYYSTLKDKELVSIGPITADTIKKYGQYKIKIAEKYNIEGLIEELIK